MWNDILVTEFRNDEIERPRKQFEREAKARERANQFIKESLPKKSLTRKKEGLMK